MSGIAGNMLRQVERAVAYAFGVGPADLRSRYRRQALVEARFVSWYLMARGCGSSAAWLSTQVEFDQTSISYGIRQIALRRRTDPDLDATVTTLAVRLFGREVETLPNHDQWCALAARLDGQLRRIASDLRLIVTTQRVALVPSSPPVRRRNRAEEDILPISRSPRRRLACITCGRDFWSDGPHNRMCSRCRGAGSDLMSIQGG